MTTTRTPVDAVEFDPRPYVRDARALVREIVGAEVRGLRVLQIRPRPNRSVTVQYEVDLDRPTPTRLVVRAARAPLAGVDPVLSDADGHPVCAFADLQDPRLPGLADATDPAKVARLFADLGVGRPTDAITLRVRAHRPLRRAVVEARGPNGRVFIKVVRPEAAERLHRRHRVLTDAGLPIAPSVGWSERGIVVLGAISGNTLREDLDAGRPLPAVADVHALLDRFPDPVTEFSGPVEPVLRLDEHAALLRLVLPEAGARLDELVTGITGLAASGIGSTPGIEPVHGDLYEAQIMTGGGRVRGFIDVDGIGAGHRINDDANALGHLSVFDLVRSHDRARRLGAAWLAELDSVGCHDPAELRARIAAVVTGLATGCYRVQERDWAANTLARLDLALAWLRSAERAATR